MAGQAGREAEGGIQPPDVATMAGGAAGDEGEQEMTRPVGENTGPVTEKMNLLVREKKRRVD